MSDTRLHTGFKAGTGHYVLVFVLSWLAWMLLAGTMSPDELLCGALVALLVTGLSRGHMDVFAGLRVELAAIWHLFMFLLVFLRSLVLANIDMARRVLSPSLPIRPAVVEVETGLQSSIGRLLLTNAITLTPGTLSVDVRDDRLLVHWVDSPPGYDLQARTDAIVGGFERHLRGFVR